MLYDYDVRKLRTVHTEAHHSSDIHEPAFLLASVLCMCCRTQDLCCCCGWFWLGKVSFSCFSHFPDDYDRTSLCDFPFNCLVYVTQE